MSITDIVGIVGFGVAFTAGVNLAEYERAVAWLDSHSGLDCPIPVYEAMQQEKRDTSKRGLARFYIGLPGRHVAYWGYTNRQNKVDN